MRPLHTAWILLLALPSLSAAQEPAPPFVAVFELEARGVALSPRVLDSLGDYLASRLAESRRYRVVPRDSLKARLVEQKKASFKACYDETCQIELGREMAAQKSLASRISKVGTRCMISLDVFDLERAASETAATATGGCSEDAILESLSLAVARLIGTVEPEQQPIRRTEPAPLPSLPELPAAEPTAAENCQGPPAQAGRWLEVRGSRRTLAVCDGPREVGRFAVGIGINGMGKEREGDRKTPLGQYRIAWIASADYADDDPEHRRFRIAPGRGYCRFDPASNVNRFDPDHGPRDERLWLPAYGGNVMALDYPNATDVVAGRTGSCIEIHGNPDPSRGTYGGVDLDPSDMRRLVGFCEPGMPVVLRR